LKLVLLFNYISLYMEFANCKKLLQICDYHASYFDQPNTGSI